MSVEVVLGLGSNLGDKQKYLELAISEMKKNNLIENVVLSSVHQTKAVLLKDSPPEWDLDFLNMAIRGTTKLLPTELIKAIKAIEKKIGRKHAATWAPREIDIDILAYGDEYIDNELRIPHKFLLERSWAIGPLAEIYPEWKYPVPGLYFQLTAKEIVSKL